MGECYVGYNVCLEMVSVSNKVEFEEVENKKKLLFWLNYIKYMYISNKGVIVRISVFF